MSNAEWSLLVLDVDGVLTDGTILFDDTGGQSRRFHIQDGLGIRMWRALGRKVGILTSKQSGAVTARARQLEIDFLEQGAEEVYACCTHGVLSGNAVERITSSNLKELIITDTLPVSDGKKHEKITVLSVAPILGEAIHRIHSGLSVGAMFQ